MTRHAAIAVVFNDQKLLVIERSQLVRAPGRFCFPGGEVEPGEHVAEAVVRELREELRLAIKPVRQIWTSVAPSGCILNWILSSIQSGSTPDPNQDEVADWHWMTPRQLADHPKALSSNLDFLDACRSGQVLLPTGFASPVQWP